MIVSVGVIVIVRVIEESDLRSLCDHPKEDRAKAEDQRGQLLAVHDALAKVLVRPGIGRAVAVGIVTAAARPQRCHGKIHRLS